MKKLSPALFLLMIAFVGCKKESKPKTTIATQKDTTTAVVRRPVLTITVNGISPASATAGTVITINGTNFGSSAIDVIVQFNGVKATVQSVAPTEIKAIVPQTSSGVVTVSINGKNVIGPVFTFNDVTVVPYTSGDVALLSQADVDAFVSLNKGKQLQLTGRLQIGNSVSTDISSVAGLSIISSVAGDVVIANDPLLTEAPFMNALSLAKNVSVSASGLTSLSLDNLNSFAGGLTLNSLNALKRVSFNGLSKLSFLTVTNCAALTDLSFLNNLTLVAGASVAPFLPASISINNIGTAEIHMDRLTTVAGAINITSCTNLTIVSFKSLQQITNPPNQPVFPFGQPDPNVGMTITSCAGLTTLDFSAMTTIPGKLSISRIGATDLSGFSALKKIGSLTVYNNPALANFHGLEHLTTLTQPAIGVGTSSNFPTRLNGVYVMTNPMLTTLAGLQNLADIPIAYISDNSRLVDFCPLKTQFTTLSTSKDLSYTVPSGNSGPVATKSIPIAALTLTNNSSYVTTPDALTAITLCR